MNWNIVWLASMIVWAGRWVWQGGLAEQEAQKLLLAALQTLGTQSQGQGLCSAFEQRVVVGSSVRDQHAAAQGGGEAGGRRVGRCGGADGAGAAAGR